jgi:hypothetical protein
VVPSVSDAVLKVTEVPAGSCPVNSTTDPATLSPEPDEPAPPVLLELDALDELELDPAVGQVALESTKEPQGQLVGGEVAQAQASPPQPTPLQQ